MFIFFLFFSNPFVPSPTHSLFPSITTIPFHSLADSPSSNFNSSSVTAIWAPNKHSLATFAKHPPSDTEYTNHRHISSSSKVIVCIYNMTAHRDHLEHWDHRVPRRRPFFPPIFLFVSSFSRFLVSSFPHFLGSTSLFFVIECGYNQKLFLSAHGPYLFHLSNPLATHPSTLFLTLTMAHCPPASHVYPYPCPFIVPFPWFPFFFFVA